MQQHGETKDNPEDPVPMESKKAELSGDSNLLIIRTY